MVLGSVRPFECGRLIPAGVRAEVSALARCFHFEEGNSDFEKVLLWAGIGLYTAVELGTAFGYVDYAALPPSTQEWMEGIRYLLILMLGRTLGKEVILERYRRPPKKPKISR